MLKKSSLAIINEMWSGDKTVEFMTDTCEKVLYLTEQYIKVRHITNDMDIMACILGVVGDLDKNSRNRLKLDEDQKAFIKTLKFVLKNELLAKD